MNPLDLDWLFTQAHPGGPTIGGYVPPVGEHILCRRPTDGTEYCGTVDDNRGGLFLTLCTAGRVVLTAANWTAHPIVHTPERPK